MNAGPTYAPVSALVLYLTDACNLRCDYCFVDKSTRRMSVETAHQAVDFFLSRKISGLQEHLSICFFGGEPFLELDLMEEIIRYSREAGPRCGKTIHFSATTNGTVVSPRVERVIRDAQMVLLVSFDGKEEANQHRPLISGHSSYERVVRNLPRLMECASSMVVRMTFHPRSLAFVSNIEFVESLADKASIALCPVLETDWRPHLAALDAAYDELAAWYIKRARDGRVPPLNITEGLLSLKHRAAKGASRPLRPCGVARDLLGIDPDGNVMPCHRFLYRPDDWLGTVESPTLSDDRWQYVHLTSADFTDCSTCMAAPICGGACPFAARSTGRSLNQPHPSFCATMRAHARAVDQIYDALASEKNVAFDQVLAGTRSQPPTHFAELTGR